MNLGLSGKVALVGGAAQGIGLAIARMLAAEGVSLGLVARRAEKLDLAAEAIRKDFSVDVQTIPGDVASAVDNQNAVDATVRRLGRLDILVNNDGAPPLGPAMEFDDTAWEKAVQQNLMSVVRLCRHAIPHMRARGGGRIINITAASVKQPPVNLALSTSTWAGVIALSKTLAREVGEHGITVNTICPGYIQTPRLQKASERQAAQEAIDFEEVMRNRIRQIPVGRVGAPDDIAAIVAFLASDLSGFITGTTIQVDGGMTQSLL